MRDAGAVAIHSCAHRPPQVWIIILPATRGLTGDLCTLPRPPSNSNQLDSFSLCGGFIGGNHLSLRCQEKSVLPRRPLGLEISSWSSERSPMPTSIPAQQLSKAPRRKMELSFKLYVPDILYGIGMSPRIVADLMYRSLAPAGLMRLSWNSQVRRSQSIDNKRHLTENTRARRRGLHGSVRPHCSAHRIRFDGSVHLYVQPMRYLPIADLWLTAIFNISALGYIRAMRELRSVDRPPRCGSGSSMGTRLSGIVFGISRHDTRELGSGERPACASSYRS